MKSNKNVPSSRFEGKLRIMTDNLIGYIQGVFCSVKESTPFLGVFKTLSAILLSLLAIVLLVITVVVGIISFIVMQIRKSVIKLILFLLAGIAIGLFLPLPISEAFKNIAIVLFPCGVACMASNIVYESAKEKDEELKTKKKHGIFDMVLLASLFFLWAIPTSLTAFATYEIRNAIHIYNEQQNDNKEPPDESIVEETSVPTTDEPPQETIAAPPIITKPPTTTNPVPPPHECMKDGCEVCNSFYNS
ncbi:MAG: hypothetical protein FWH20_05135 [Oscillospiraceae bacterium]|nr:hypothetical protein [Oscillospiraceae bacterium]